MKRSLFLLMVCLICAKTYGQGSAGLVAHWDFNGESNDVSGNGHTGHAFNTIDTTGSTGVPHTAYYFDGSTSMVTAAYAADLNLTKYSICATIKPTGFYQGSCLSNAIIGRGQMYPIAGEYCLYYTNVINECSTYDTTSENFVSQAGTNTPIPNISAFSATPVVTKNSWIRVVVTYDSTTWKIYVNDTLRSTVSGQSYPIGTSADSISIGMSIYDAPIYPYYFKGMIDDIRLYSKALADTDVLKYGIVCGGITAEPVMAKAVVGGSAFFSVATSVTTPSYQWQQDAGTGFVNLTNSGPYSGVTTDTLKITGITSLLAGDHYRCLISNPSGCSDTTTGALLASTTGISNVDELISIYPNPTKTKINIQLQYVETASVQLLNAVGQVISEKSINETVTEIDLTQLPQGMYIIKAMVNNQYYYKKIIKD